MATRSTRFILKNNDNSAAPFSGATLFAGEPIVNTAAGIMMFSGKTGGSADWTSAGDGAANSGGNNNFFEVGSNLYNLKIRNKITSYSGITNLDGKFLSGTTNGFVLAAISDIAGVDTYVTGFTYTSSTNTIYLRQNFGQAEKPIYIDSFSGLTINGTLSGVTGNFTTANIDTLNSTGGTINTLTANTFSANSGSVSASATNPTDIVNYQTLTSYTQTNDVYVTGATYTGASVNSNNTSWTLQYHSTPLNGPYTISGKDTYTTGGTYNNTTKLITLLRNDGTTGYTVDLSNIDTNDTYVTGGTITQSPSNNNITGQTTLSYNNPEIGTYTLPFTDVFLTGFTYNPTDNSFTLKDNSGNTFSQSINAVSGLTVNNLVAGQVVYAGANKELKSDSDFTFDDSQNKLIVTNLAVNNTSSAATFGTGGVVIGSGGNYGTPGTGDLTVHGSLTVFGPSISAYTSQLYIEDYNIIINYNPSGSSSGTSIGAGFTVQDGQGSNNLDVNLQIVGLYNLTGNTGDPSPKVPYTSEYDISNDGRTNRGWITELNDIVIRSSDILTPKGVRVLAEFDVLDGGSY